MDEEEISEWNTPCQTDYLFVSVSSLHANKTRHAVKNNSFSYGMKCNPS